MPRHFTIRRFSILAAAGVLALASTGCDKAISAALGARSKPSVKLGPGVLAGHSYSHDYFGLKLDIPGNWSIAPREAHDTLSDEGVALIAGSKSSLKNQIDAAKPRTHNLLMASRHPLGKPVAFNHNIIISAEDVHLFPGVADGGDYLTAAQKGLEQAGGVRMTFGPLDRNAKLGGQPAASIESKLTVGNMIVKQRMYALKVKDYCLVFVLSYADDAQLRELEQIVAATQLGG